MFVRLVRKTVSHQVQIGRTRLAGRKAVTNRARRKRARRLLTRESFLRSRGNYAVGTHHRRRGIQTLDDIAFALGQTREFLALEGHTISQAADPKYIHLARAE